MYAQVWDGLLAIAEHLYSVCEGTTVSDSIMYCLTTSIVKW